MLKIDAYVAKIARAHPGIREIWLFGSRAKGPAHPKSDWNLFVFADDDTLQQLGKSLQFRRGDVQLLVVRDGDEFREPWGANPKQGYLSEWEWVKISDREAQYCGIKWAQEEKGGQTAMELCKAIRLWPMEKQ
ncbi:MAG: nucleotidyltransferase domain-containing protein [Deltaproteobacteria bacterium]|jgi:polymorphic toxin system nucleotidyltransferase-like protein